VVAALKWAVKKAQDELKATTRLETAGTGEAA
jgi:hypothetical protein